MSTTRPSIAAAAAICGESRWVRPPRPWRPSKLRLDVDAQRWPGLRMSGFMPRHIEHPRLGLCAPALGPGDAHRVDRRRDLAALDHRRGGAQVADARVRARPDE